MRLYCSDHRCAHFADKIAQEAKAEKERIRGNKTKGFQGQRHLLDPVFWKDPNEKESPEWLRWFMFAVVLCLAMLAVYGAIEGN
jgi:hypothetical protein